MVYLIIGIINPYDIIKKPAYDIIKNNIKNLINIV